MLRVQRSGSELGAFVFNLTVGAYPTPVTRVPPDAVMTRSMVISERVNVPVLSEQMTERSPAFRRT